MKYIKCTEAEIIKNSDTSSLLEYSKKLNEQDLDFCINTISGRYPETGFCSNLECKELCYILEGTGSLNKETETINFSQGDVLLIDKKEKYYWNGSCKIIMVCNPAWSNSQCKLYK